MKSYRYRGCDMASKVLSIKLDEKEIERLKCYHEVLKRLGIISDKTLSMNGLYKHLLLDYLEEDIRRVVSSCASCGLLPRYFSPDVIENNNISFVNTYGLDDEKFSLYMECVKESMSNLMNEMEKDIDVLNTVARKEIVFFEGGSCSIIPLPLEEERSYDIWESFWVDKAIEERENYDKDVQKNGVLYDYKMINNASISEKEKKELIAAIDDYEKSRVKNIHFINGRIREGSNEL